VIAASTAVGSVLRYQALHSVFSHETLTIVLTHSLWVPSHSRFFLPIPVLRRVFRRKSIIALKRNFRQGKLGFHGTLKPLAHPKAFSAWLRTLFRHHWHDCGENWAMRTGKA